MDAAPVNPQLVEQLKNLHDFHAPDPIGLWPPAPGWIVLTVLLLCLLIWAGLTLYRRHQRNAWRREALRHLDWLQANLPGSENGAAHAAVNRLLKQCLASQHSRDPEQRRALLGMSGETWAALLTQSSHALTPDDIHLFAYGQYQPTPPELGERHLFRVRNWIRSLPQ